MTGIIHIRLSGEPDDVTAFAALVTAIPGITATGLAIRENRQDPGVRGYLTAAISHETADRNDNAR